MFDRIMDAGKEINSHARLYDPRRRNSNSAADQKLRDAGAPSPQRDDFGKYYSPGSDRRISPAPPPPKDPPLSDGPWVLPPIDGDTNQEMPANDGHGKRGALGQIQAAEIADGKIADRLSAGTAAAPADRTLVLSGFGRGRIPGADRDAPFDRMAKIKTLMGYRHSEYWRGPEADDLQQEYRDLVETSERDTALRERIARFPEAARTLIGSSINADAQPDLEAGALADRMAELRTLMADRHSEYWSGPKADTLQQEYRDLIEMRDRRKKREEELLAYEDASGPGTA